MTIAAPVRITAAVPAASKALPKLYHWGSEHARFGIIHE
jgi:hypothetical protein